MDVVYVLGTGSQWKDNELRYSLRSVEKHLKNYNRIFIVGEIPPWIRNVVAVKCRVDESQKERNIKEKIEKACTTDVSEDFIFNNDDHFLMQDMDARTFPNYCGSKSLMKEADGRHPHKPYTSSIWNTANALTWKNFPTVYFDVHTPIIYNKITFPAVMGMYDWKVPYCYIIKSIYCNSLNKAGQVIADCKIDEPLPVTKLQEILKGRPMFSIGDSGLTVAMKSLIESMYPEKSKYEE
jgi:hypothetical protein